MGKSPHKLVYGREVQLLADLATMGTDPWVKSFVELWSKVEKN